jgi:hypothetical protein
MPVARRKGRVAVLHRPVVGQHNREARHILVVVRIPAVARIPAAVQSLPGSVVCIRGVVHIHRLGSAEYMLVLDWVPLGSAVAQPLPVLDSLQLHLQRRTFVRLFSTRLWRQKRWPCRQILHRYHCYRQIGSVDRGWHIPLRHLRQGRHQ